MDSDDSGKSSRDTGFHARLFRAWLLLQSRVGRKMNQTELGERMGERGGGKAVGQTTVSGWFVDTIPSLYDICRLAKALSEPPGLIVDPGWLAFGESSSARGPEDAGPPIPTPPPPKR